MLHPRGRFLMYTALTRAWLAQPAIRHAHQHPWPIARCSARQGHTRRHPQCSPGPSPVPPPALAFSTSWSCTSMTRLMAFLLGSCSSPGRLEGGWNMGRGAGGGRVISGVRQGMGGGGKTCTQDTYVSGGPLLASCSSPRSRPPFPQIPAPSIPNAAHCSSWHDIGCIAQLLCRHVSATPKPPSPTLPPTHPPAPSPAMSSSSRM